MHTDTVAKLLHEWARPDGPGPQWRLPSGTTVIVDEAGMLSTPNLHQLTQLATSEQWRLVLVGDHRQLQAVGRGGLFAEICATVQSDRVGADPPVHPRLGSRRVAAPASRRPTRPRHLRGPRADHPRHLRRAPRRDRRASGCDDTPPGRRWRSRRRPTSTSTRSTAPSANSGPGPVTPTPPRSRSIADGLCRRRRHRRHPPQPAPVAHHQRRHRPQPRTVDRHRDQRRR